MMVALAALAACICSQGSLLSNPGFESTVVHEGWSLHVYGARPDVRSDREVVRSGRQSLKVQAREPSDVALGQEVRLREGRWYRLSGWIRTEGLDPHGSPVFGTLQVQMPGGSTVLATGKNRRASTAWVREDVWFRAPSGGLTRIAIFFVGYGKGVGAAWFDEIRLEEVTSQMSTVVVKDAASAGVRISPMQYGQFVEYLCNLVGGMWAEKLYDNSFEGLTPYGFEHIKEKDFREQPWYPSGATHRGVFTRDAETKVTGTQSMRIEGGPGAPAWLGVSQDGIWANPRTSDILTVWLRQDGVVGPVRVRLHDEREALAECAFRPGSDWRKYSARLRPNRAHVSATLTVEFRGPGTLWIDNAFLMAGDNISGWRRDVVEAVRSLRPGVIRFGGSVVDYAPYGDYNWLKTMGPVEKRMPFRSWGGLQPIGAGLGEFVEFCRLVNAEPLMCVRFRGSTPEEAAKMVEYFNGPVATPMGRVRAEHGHPTPYGVRLWQVGNEVQSEDYDTQVSLFCRAMKAADPSISLLSSYPTEAVVRRAGAFLDYVCPHHYGCGNLDWVQSDVDRLRAIIADQAPGRPIKIAVTEWNTTAGDRGTGRAMLWTLGNALACSRYHNLMHRNADIIEIANRSNLTNSFCSGVIQTDNHRLYRTPTYLAQEMYASFAGDIPLEVASDLPTKVGLDISATRSSRTGAVTVFVVNDGPIAESRTLTGLGGPDAAYAEVRVLEDSASACEPDVTNSFGRPDRVRVRVLRAPLKSGTLKVEFPPYTVTAVIAQRTRR